MGFIPNSNATFLIEKPLRTVGGCSPEVDETYGLMNENHEDGRKNR